MDTTVKTPLMQKQLTELTVGDYVKLNVGVVAITAAAIVGGRAYVAVKDRVNAFRRNRQTKKSENNLNTES